MNSNTPGLLSDLADAVGGTIHEVEQLPDGSGFATMSLPLPEDHWLYETDEHGYTPRPTYPMLAGEGSKARDYLSRIIVECAKYGVKCATRNGRNDDFDPDALVRNVEIGAFGLFTKNGLSGDPSDQRLFDPIQPGSLPKVLLETLALAINDGLLTPRDVTNAIDDISLRLAAARQTEREEQREREYQELRIRKGWDKLDCQAETTDVPPSDEPRQEI